MKLRFTLLLCAWVGMAFSASEKKASIFMIGDSSMADQEIAGKNPQRGWGQMLPTFFESGMMLENHAQNVHIQEFVNKGYWDGVLSKLKEGDYLFIQFGLDENMRESTELYKKNLRRFVREARQQGANPVLFTPIAEHDFRGGVLVESRTRYVLAVKQVAEEESVPLVDLYKETQKWLTNLDADFSKKWYLYVPAGENPTYPAGISDGGHLSICGARLVARIAIEEIAEVVPALDDCLRYYDFVVAKDGSGDFFTVQEAIDAVPFSRSVSTDILVRKGVYKEQVFVPCEKIRIHLIGEDADSTVITNDYYKNTPNRLNEYMGIMGCATMLVYGNEFTAENLTITNTSGENAAVTLLTGADRLAFKKCSILGTNGTIFNRTRNDRVCFENCYIHGNQDYISGKSVVVFDGCEIHSCTNGSITAVSTPEYCSYGYLFYRCHLTAEPGVKMYLGRSMRSLSQVAFVECEMDDIVNPDGWYNNDREMMEMKAVFVEINNTGAGADMSNRVDWITKPSKKMDYTPDFYLNRHDNISLTK